MRVFFTLLILLIVVISVSGYYFSRKKFSLLNTVHHVDLKKYAGIWYEIARLPNSFEKKCQCVEANYTIENGYIGVTNTCLKNKKYQSVQGKAWPVKDSNQSKLKVQFFWPFKGNYWIIYLDEYYQYAIVGEPRRKYLWILARQRTISEDKLKKLISIAKQANFDVKKLIKTEQSSCQ